MMLVVLVILDASKMEGYSKSSAPDAVEERDRLASSASSSTRGQISVVQAAESFMSWQGLLLSGELRGYSAACLFVGWVVG